MKIGLFLPDGPFCHIRKLAGALEKLGHDCTTATSRECDVLFASDVTVAVEADRVSKENGVPVCQQVLDLPEWRFNDPYFEGKYKEYREVLERADKVVTISRATADAVKRIWGISSQPIGYPVDDEKIRSIPASGEKHHQVVGVGRFDLRKNFQQAVQAVSFLENPPRFVLIGPPHTLDGGIYSRLAREYEVELRLLASAPDEVKYLEIKRSKLLVAPSVFEGLGLPPIEAVLCGTPIVVNDMPVTREVFGEKAAYCDGSDPESIARELTALIEDEEKGRRMVETLRQKMEYFFMDAYAKRLADVLENML